MLIINAEIHTMDKKNTVIKNGYIGFAYGKILSLGSMNELNSITGEVIDAKGGIIYPGLIDAHTHLGMYGDSLTFEGDDCNEDTEPVTPHLRAIDAVNPMDRYFDEAVCAGVTSVITGPGSANPIAGQLAAVKTYGKRIDNMVIKAPVGIKFALGENPKSSYNDKEQMPVTRMATAALIREALFRARKYYRDRCNYENDRENFDEPEFDIKNDALLPLFKKEIPAHFHVHRADDIFTAVRIAKEFDIDYVLVHATEAHLVCDELKEEKMNGVLSGPVLTDRSKPELKNQNLASAGILSSNGIKTAIISDHPETPVKHLLLCAAVAVREGMDREEAMRAVTRYPAEICGIFDKVGSLEKNKDADIVVLSSDPIDIMSRVMTVVINGKVVKNLFCDNV